MSCHLAELGANVVLVARSVDELEATAAEVETEALVAPADVRDSDAIQSVIDSAIDGFGRIDALINNAAVEFLSFGEERKPIVETTEEEWDVTLDVNLKGVFLASKHVLPTMIEQQAGNIINISSGLGRRAKANAVPYTASKWGLEGLTRGLALEVENDGINVNALDPGGQVNTRIWSHLPEEERERLPQPDVMDNAAALLAAQGPNGITGESMTAQGWEQRFE